MDFVIKRPTFMCSTLRSAHTILSISLLCWVLCLFFFFAYNNWLVYQRVAQTAIFPKICVHSQLSGVRFTSFEANNSFTKKSAVATACLPWSVGFHSCLILTLCAVWTIIIFIQRPRLTWEGTHYFTSSHKLIINTIFFFYLI